MLTKIFVHVQHRKVDDYSEAFLQLTLQQYGKEVEADHLAIGHNASISKTAGYENRCDLEAYNLYPLLLYIWQ